MVCRAELRGLRNAYDYFRKEGAEVVAISVEDPLVSKQHVERAKLPFPILADPDRALLRRLGMIHPGAGLDGSDVAVPATYVIARDGTIAWLHKSDNVRMRPDPAEVLAAVRAAAKP
jgi:peroxiredoxin